jgi:hypothetical protein
MKIKIVYFTFLVPNKWEEIVLEQLNMLKSLELYNIAEIYMSVISESNVELENLKKILQNDFNKIQLINVYNTNVYEYPGIKTVYELSENDDNTLILYFHSKGMTSDQHEIRKKLFNNTIKNYEIYIDEFINNPSLEVAGMVPSNGGFVWYNFWWVRSSYVHNYCSKPENTPEYIKEGRYTWEAWLGNEYSNKKEKIITYSPIMKYNCVYDSAHATSTIEKIPFDHDYNNFDKKNILFDIEISKENFEKFTNINENYGYDYIFHNIFIILLIIIMIIIIIIYIFRKLKINKLLKKLI